MRTSESYHNALYPEQLSNEKRTSSPPVFPGAQSFSFPVLKVSRYLPIQGSPKIAIITVLHNNITNFQKNLARRDNTVFLN